MNVRLSRVIVDVPDEVADLSAMCLVAYLYLHYSDHPLTVAEISEASGRPATSVRRALRQLAEETRVVEREISTKDSRRYVYQIST